MVKRYANLIGGEWIEGASTKPNRNPSDVTDVIGEYAQADAAQTLAAIAAARQAFPAWSTGPIQQRFDILDRAGTEILARKDELGALLSREEGKTLPEGVGEAARAGYIFKFFAGETLRLAGERVPSVRPGVDVEITREPIGVVGLIAPWNFPIAIPAWKIAPALAYGNTVVMKPADLVPGCSWAIADILARAGLPAGVFNLVMGRGSVVGEAIIASPDVAGVSFTGSVATGRAIAAKLVARMAKVQVEMGGKNPLVVLDDADLNVAVNAAIQGAYYSTGQRCTASSRLIVTQGIHDRFVRALSERMSALKVDDALAAGTDIGPVVDESQLAQDLEYVGIGKAEGANLVAGVSFTGSVATGRAIAAKLVARMAKVQLEMGGKNPLVVLDDADLNVAVNAAVQGAYYSTGQRCTASSRLIVTQGIHDRFVRALSERMSSLKVDDALAAGTDIGPVVDDSQLAQDLEYVGIGKAEGAKLVAGGERLARAKNGYYFAPALFTETTNDMRIAREEIFGPVATVIRAKDYDEALALANDTEFGLCSGVVTTSLKHASHFRRHAQAGMVMVNLPTAGVDYHVPFGGRKGSSYGPREQGRYAAEFYTTVKTAYIAP